MKCCIMREVVGCEIRQQLPEPLQGSFHMSHAAEGVCHVRPADHSAWPI